jgi:hypothetical protein
VDENGELVLVQAWLNILSMSLKETGEGGLSSGVFLKNGCFNTQQQLALLIINRGRDTALWERRSSRRVGGGVRSSCAYPVFATLCNYAISGLLIQSLLSVG